MNSAPSTRPVRAERSQRLRLALRDERRDRLGVDRAPDEPVRRVAQKCLTGRGTLFEPRGHVDRVPDSEGVALADDDLAGVHADPALDSDSPVALELVVEPAETLTHVPRRADSAKSVVLVHHRDTEDGHDGVADELLDGAAVALDGLPHGAEVVGHDAPRRLGVEAFAHCGGAGDIAEDNRHRLPNLSGSRRGDELGAAGAAETKAFGIVVSAGRTAHDAILWSRPGRPTRARCWSRLSRRARQTLGGQEVPGRCRERLVDGDASAFENKRRIDGLDDANDV
jgi:hypothetical protein